MAARRKLPWRGALATIVGAAMLTTVVRSVTAQPSTSVRPSDVRNAERVVAPLNGAVDMRVAVPSGELVAGNGVIEPADRETRVAGAVSARVVRVLVQEGARVRVGDPLVELEHSTETAALAAVEAEVLVARAQLARAVHGSRREDVDAAGSEYDAARARASLSASVLARTEALAREGHATGDELERAQRQAEIDQASARQVEARRRATLSGSRREDIDVARAQLAAAEARREQSRAALELRTVRAPIEGEVLQVKVRAGEYYAPGADPLVVLGDTRTLRARVDIDEREIARIAVGRAAFVTADAFGPRRFAGTVVEIARRFGRRNIRTDDPAERIDTKVLEVVLELREREGLIPGQRVVGYLEGSPAPYVSAAPPSAGPSAAR